MAAQTKIPKSDVLLTDIRDTLVQYNNSSCTNDVVSFFDSRANINHWSFRKPYATNEELFQLEDEQIRKINCGFNFDNAQLGSYTTLPERMDGDMNGWVYTRPEGTARTPYRLGDYVGYVARANPMISNFYVADKISYQSSEASATAMCNQKDGEQVSLEDIESLKDYKSAVFFVKGTEQRKYEGTPLSGGVFDVAFPPSEFTVGTWTAYPFLIGGSTNSTYYMLPNVQPKTFEIVSELDDLFIQAQYVYKEGTTEIESVQFKFTLYNRSSGPTTNNWVYLTQEKEDLEVESGQGEWSEPLLDFDRPSPTEPFNYPYDLTGEEWAEIPVNKFDPTKILFLTISIGTARLVRSTNIVSQNISPL